jgi:hypothetical protein
MTRRIKDLPEHDRPRERLLARGAEALSERELLALQLGKGRRGESALDLAAALLAEHGGLARIAAARPEELARRPGIGPAKGTALLAEESAACGVVAAGAGVTAPPSSSSSSSPHARPANAASATVANRIAVPSLIFVNMRGSLQLRPRGGRGSQPHDRGFAAAGGIGARLPRPPCPHLCVLCAFAVNHRFGSPEKQRPVPKRWGWSGTGAAYLV